MAVNRELVVRGITCTGCEDRITGALTGVAGVESASADHEEGLVLVSVEPSAVSEAEMRDASRGWATGW